ncbi:MAG: FKBP-type peptidyl-prolyl cis-trans isomerase [Bacteroidaceae bacterium]|nr:FKBP-type peptidyl-prolyl cis-trans isomerase [Bacteroidaceae bacterium]
MGAFMFPLFCVAGSLLFTSCEETAEVDEYANWKERNIAFIDSIAAMAEADADGEWMRILSFKLNNTDVNGNPADFDNEDYIYCQIIEKGMGAVSPKFTDTVQVNYRGRLIPTLSFPEGKVFDQSYKGAINPATAVPAKFSVGGVIVGWSTALQHMVKGDIWRVYIPADLAYGSSKQTDIPANSALIFDMNLVGFYPIGTPVPDL